MRLSPIRVTITVLFVVLVAALGVAGASAHSTLAPENLIEPTLSGGTTVGSTLTATTGAWANQPTSFIYKWQRCSTDGTGCNKDLRISGKKTYTLAAGDVGHTVRVVVTAANSNGRGDAAPSAATGVISSKGGSEEHREAGDQRRSDRRPATDRLRRKLDTSRRRHHVSVAALRHR